MFVDKVKIYIKAGNGGNGCVSFLREKYVAKGGPDGGNGGRGGAVILKATSDEQSLINLRFQQHCTAKNGAPGQGKKRQGANASDLILLVPLGTMIINFENKEILADLNDEGQIYLAAKGGIGGRGNKCFATSTNRVPRHYEEGTQGDELILYLELKIIADVGFVGYPNAGKSTLLNSISNTKSKTASYPFTTLHPQIGNIKFEDYTHLTIADIPGLVDGSSNNIGLGHKFLKHIERTHILVFIIDMAGTDQRLPNEDFQNLQKELELYKKSLSKKVQLIIANKMDGKNSVKNLQKLEKLTSLPILPIIAELDEGVDKVVKFLYKKNIEIKKTLAKTKETTNLKLLNDKQILNIIMPKEDDTFFD